jgi:hypothetical protein
MQPLQPPTESPEKTEYRAEGTVLPFTRLAGRLVEVDQARFWEALKNGHAARLR